MAVTDRGTGEPIRIRTDHSHAPNINSISISISKYREQTNRRRNQEQGEDEVHCVENSGRIPGTSDQNREPDVLVKVCV